MELKENEVIRGFVVERIREIKDCGGSMVEMKHQKTGAELVFMDRECENKTFAIAFKTIPENDTGVFHILEHSVLNGSDKYPVKEPFVELLKSSMQTFLNAMTYPDKTLYPVSSRNEKDFRNLMDVYLDAVFHPAIYHNPNIFYQEGWHYEIRSEADQPVYKGVVYSEMQGAFANVDELIMTEASRMLFQDNCYRFVSGGDPEHIPDLSYEEFLATHKKFYHPSNARIYLDGSMDLESVLGDIDGYLSEYEKQDISFDIPFQEELPAMDRTITYEISPEEDSAERTHIALMKLTGSFQDVEKMFAWQALIDLLAGSNEAPFKRAVLENGLGQDVELATLDGMQQMFYLLVVRNTEAEKKGEIIRVLRESARELVENGLNHDKLKAALNQMEFRFREPTEPSGIIFADDALKSWLYGGDPALYLSCGGVFETLRQKTDQGYFEQLVRDSFLDEEHISSLTVIPSAVLGEERRQAVEEKLRNIKASWGNRVQEYISKNEALDLWQASEDTPEALAALPKLELSDVSPDPVPFEPTVKEIRGVPVLLYPAEPSGIVYINLYFNLAGIRLADLPALAMYCGMLEDLPTKKKTVEELQEAVRAKLGSLSFSPAAFTMENDREKTLPVLIVSCSVLKQNVSEAIDLILEVLQETVFEKETVRALTAQTVEGMRQGMIAGGHNLALLRCSSQWSAAGAASEAMSGFTAVKWTTDFLEHFDEKIEAFLDQTEMFSQVLYNMRRLTASITGEENLPHLERLVDALPWMDFERCVVRYPLSEKHRTGIVIPAAVSYSAAAVNLTPYGYSYDGSLRVLSQMLTYGYLWSEVRVKGGAYGTGFSAGQTGGITVYSYRDPDPSANLKAVAGIPEFIRGYEGDQEELISYIIGTIASGEPLLSPAGRIRNANMRWFTGVDYEYRKQHRRQMLETTVEQIKSWSEPLEKALEDISVCVVGNEQTLHECGIEEENILRLNSKTE